MSSLKFRTCTVCVYYLAEACTFTRNISSRLLFDMRISMYMGISERLCDRSEGFWYMKKFCIADYLFVQYFLHSLNTLWSMLISGSWVKNPYEGCTSEAHADQYQEMSVLLCIYLCSDKKENELKVAVEATLVLILHN